MARTLQKNVRVTPGQWDRIENAAKERDVSANRLVVELAMEALDRREWPRTEAEIQVARASLFAAQVLARDLIYPDASRRSPKSATSSPLSCPMGTPESRFTAVPTTGPMLPN